MHDGFQLNDRYIQWSSIGTIKGKSVQEISALELIRMWRDGRQSFHAETSGSTGSPRQITFRRSTAELSARKTLQFFDITENDHALISMDIQKIAGKMMVIRALVGGLKFTICEPVRSPDIRNNSYTFTALAPIQLQALLDSNATLSTFTCILVGGAPVGLPLASRIREHKLPVWETYGMTETLSHIAVREITDDHPRTPFETIHPLELRVDEKDCLAIRGEITHDQWIQTTDRIELLSKRTFRWLGRADFVINSGGVKLQPEEIEDTIAPIMNKLGISEFFIHGVPHPEFGEAAVLIIEGSCPVPATDLLARLKEVLPGKYQLPKKILVADTFYFGPTGKLNRQETARSLPFFIF